MSLGANSKSLWYFFKNLSHFLLTIKAPSHLKVSVSKGNGFSFTFKQVGCHCTNFSFMILAQTSFANLIQSQVAERGFVVFLKSWPFHQVASTMFSQKKFFLLTNLELYTNILHRSTDNILANLATWCFDIFYQ